MPIVKQKRGTQAQDTRKFMLAKIHIAKNQTGTSEEEYRAALKGRYGVSSAGDLNLNQLHDFLAFFSNSLKWQARRGSAPRGLGVKKERNKNVPAILEFDPSGLGREELMGKIEAMLAEKGRVEGTHMPWAYAVAILKRQSGGITTCFEHAKPAQLAGVIAALYRDAKRKGRRME